MTAFRRVLVCGGRDFKDSAFLQRELDKLNKLHSFEVLIEGDARGADRLAGEWAVSRGIENLKFPADWKKHGRAAGPIRNQRMLEEGKPDLVVAFPGGRGTENMARQAGQRGLPVVSLKPS